MTWIIPRLRIYKTSGKRMPKWWRLSVTYQARKPGPKPSSRESYKPNKNSNCNRLLLNRISLKRWSYHERCVVFYLFKNYSQTVSLGFEKKIREKKIKGYSSYHPSSHVTLMIWGVLARYVSSESRYTVYRIVSTVNIVSSELLCNYRKYCK